MDRQEGQRILAHYVVHSERHHQAVMRGDWPTVAAELLQLVELANRMTTLADGPATAGQLRLVEGDDDGR